MGMRWNVSERSMEVNQVSFGMQWRNFATVVMRNVGQCMCVFSEERSLMTLWPPDDFSTRKMRLVKGGVIIYTVIHILKSK